MKLLKLPQLHYNKQLTPSFLKFGSTSRTHSETIGCHISISLEKIVLYGGFLFIGNCREQRSIAAAARDAAAACLKGGGSGEERR